MPKTIAIVAASLLTLCAMPAVAQPAEGPDQAEKTINTYVYMKDGAGNKVFLETSFWRNDSNYDARSLKRLTDIVAGLEKLGFKSSADAARGWDKPEKVTRCRITLETLNKRWKGKSGTLVACENSPVSDIEIQGSEDATHVKKVLDDFTKLFNLTKEKMARG